MPPRAGSGRAGSPAPSWIPSPALSGGWTQSLLTGTGSCTVSSSCTGSWFPQRSQCGRRLPGDCCPIPKWVRPLKPPICDRGSEHHTLSAMGPSLHPLDEGASGREETGSRGPPAGRAQGLCLPSVRVPVAIYMPAPCAARSRTLENILMHGKNLTGRAEKTRGIKTQQRSRDKRTQSF